MNAQIRDRLRSGGCSVGSWMQLPCTGVAEIMGAAGFDWVAVDLEHGSIGVESLPDLFRAITLGGSVPFARVAQGSCKDIKQALDAGARGIIVPMIESEAQLRQAIAWAKFPPVGVRGVGYSRANLFGKNFAEYLGAINRDLLMVAQIESIHAIETLDAIASVPGLDAMLIGPYDLSASMGITGQFDHPEFHRALSKYEATGRKHGVPIGLHIVQPDEALLADKIAKGYQFIAYGIDAVFLQRQATNPALHLHPKK